MVARSASGGMMYSGISAGSSITSPQKTAVLFSPSRTTISGATLVRPGSGTSTVISGRLTCHERSGPPARFPAGQLGLATRHHTSAEGKEQTRHAHRPDIGQYGPEDQQRQRDQYMVFEAADDHQGKSRIRRVEALKKATAKDTVINDGATGFDSNFSVGIDAPGPARATEAIKILRVPSL